MENGEVKGHDPRTCNDQRAECVIGNFWICPTCDAPSTVIVYTAAHLNDLGQAWGKKHPGKGIVTSCQFRYFGRHAESVWNMLDCGNIVIGAATEAKDFQHWKDILKSVGWTAEGNPNGWIRASIGAEVQSVMIRDFTFTFY